MSSSTQYSIGTFTGKDGVQFPAMVIQESVFPLATLPNVSSSIQQCATTLSLFEQWESAAPELDKASVALSAEPSNLAIKVSELRTEVPVAPRQIICAGANYYKHVVDLVIDSADAMDDPDATPEQRRKLAENMMDHRREHGQPYCFIKPVSTLLAPYDDLVVPADTEMPDWELELAVVIGKTARRVDRQDALSFVAGYTIANDVTSRDHLRRKDIPRIGMDWVASKGQPGYCPLGPTIVPARFVADPQDLWIEFKLNGDVMQSESTSDMIFDVAHLIEFISTHMTIMPGDIICTGSPSGNGTHYNRFLTPGDIMDGSISGLGAQRNICVAEELPENAARHRPFKPLDQAQ